MKATYIGGPTMLLEMGGLRLLTDPTFDPKGETFPAATYALRKTSGPALAADALGQIDAVLLSHDHHADNLDRSGRALLPKVTTVLTTMAGAERLVADADHPGIAAKGMAPWQTVDLAAPDGRTLRITATPCRHGPEGGDRGPVVGFVLQWVGPHDSADVPAPPPSGEASPDAAPEAVYLTGDTVWYEGVQEVANRFPVRVVFLFAGAALVPQVGPEPLTFSTGDAVAAARAFPDAKIVPLHYEGWEHFSQPGRDLKAAFAAAGLEGRLQWLAPGTPVEV